MLIFYTKIQYSRAPLIITAPRNKIDSGLKRKKKEAFYANRRMNVISPPRQFPALHEKISYWQQLFPALQKSNTTLCIKQIRTKKNGDIRWKSPSALKITILF